DDQVRNVQFCPTDERFLASSGRQDEAYVWDLQTRAPIKKFRAYSNGHAGCFSPDGGTFFVAGHRTLAMWDLAEALVDAIGGVVSCRTVKIFDDNKKVATLNAGNSYRQSLSVFDTRHGASLEHPFDGQLFRCMDMAPSGIGYLCSTDGVLLRWDANTGDVEELNIARDRESSSVTAIAIDPRDQDRIALGYSDGSATLCNWSKSSLERMRGIAPKTAVSRLKFAGDLVIAADNQSNLTIGDTEQKRWKETFHHLHDDWAWAIAVSKDGNTVATGSWDHTIKVWDIHTGEVKQTIVGVFDTIHGIALVDDDQTIVAATGNGSIRFFDIDSGRLKARFEGHQDTAYGLAVSPDEKLIVSSGRRYGRLRLWRIADERMVENWLTIPAK
ncbi:WD40 repeat domain-containing protein, partial [Stieleria mannarensis]|uniref:WD40 repeat domain-containing protein n=1 Tax=Stieleria mannarensis TaxID=2755585 RepID=UPI001C71F89C